MIKKIKIKILAKDLAQVHNFLNDLYHKGLIEINADGQYYVKQKFSRKTSLPVKYNWQKKFKKNEVLKGRGENTNDKQVIKKILNL